MSAVHISIPENFLRSRFTTNVDHGNSFEDSHFISASVNNNLLALHVPC